MEENLGFWARALSQQILVNEVKDIVAVSIKFLFNLGLVVFDEG